LSGSSFAGRGSRRRGIVFIVLVLISVVLLAVSDTGPVTQLRRGLNFAVAPIRDGLSESTRSATGFLDALGEVDVLRRENLTLQDRVNVLEDEAAAHEALRVRNRELSKVLKTRESIDYKTILAEVVSAPASRLESIVSIDRGSEAGISVGNPVLSEGGAVAGSVIDVSNGRSDVQLINDTRSIVIGRDSRTRATGNIVGRLSAPLAMGEIPATKEVAIGDLVVTAGLNKGRRFKSRFPGNLPIGRIVSIEEEPGLVVLTALVEPKANLANLEMVLVVIDYEGPVRIVEEPPEES
jgi:rod shape-determining protein MreC